jgi:hypothetical protein
MRLLTPRLFGLGWSSLSARKQVWWLLVKIHGVFILVGPARNRGDKCPENTHLQPIPPKITSSNPLAHREGYGYSHTLHMVETVFGQQGGRYQHIAAALDTLRSSK